ncbi:MULTISPECIES: winged helix-turn-helix domain-containing protein [unclassified Phenylobacterium]|uniref:winged helix-turn-helix domain-containing protein n=1 Tax=unclassified Phenylobacterium TaxID=2640670 RepID=UPI00083B3B59|nr:MULTISPECIES: winged helix-turn-helix domain-containing protein [unclassified Phenylobacterium]
MVLAREQPFRLGGVEVRPATRELVGPGGREVLEPRVMQVLVALARAPGEILTREDLTESCWEGRVVGEDALSRVISRLRRASEGVGRDGWTLETVTKVGYRLLPAGHDPRASPLAPAVAPPARRRVLAATGAAGVSVLGGAAWWLWRPGRISPKARDLYEKGREAMRPGLREGTAQAVGFLREAVAEEPNFVDAWGALALAYQASLRFTAPAKQPGVRSQAEAAARRALDLDPREPQASAALALLAPIYRNWGPAERLYLRALALHAREGELELAYARLLIGVGRMRDAVTHAQAAVVEDEFAVWRQYMLALTLWGAGRLEEADTVVARALARWPGHYALWFQQLSMFMFSGRADRAAAMGADPANRPLNIPAADVEISLSVARALASGAPGDIRSAADLNLERARKGVGYAENAITALSVFGRLDEAFAVARALYFGEGFAIPGQRFSAPVYAVEGTRNTHILFLPPTHAMRADPRFPGLMRDLGLADYWRTSRHPPDDPAWARV